MKKYQKYFNKFSQISGHKTFKSRRDNSYDNSRIHEFRIDAKRKQMMKPQARLKKRFIHKRSSCDNTMNLLDSSKFLDYSRGSMIRKK